MPEDDRSVERVAQAAAEEMEYLFADPDAGLSMAASRPAQLKFTEEPTQATRRFHVELYRRGFGDLDHDPGRRYGEDMGGAFYDGEIVSREHYSRMKVLVFRAEVVRLYPKDEWKPTVDEVKRVIEAIQEGFGATLEHDPIDREAAA